MEEPDSNISSNYMTDLELNAFNWTAGLVYAKDFSDRSEYQKMFLKKQYNKFLNKLKVKY